MANTQILAQNIQYSVKDNVLTLVIQLDAETHPSKSGKTQVVASTNGNLPVPGAPVNLRLGVNAYFGK